MADISQNIPSIGPLPLRNLSHAHCEARAFHVANELDIFSKLDGEEMTSQEVAGALGLEQQP